MAFALALRKNAKLRTLDLACNALGPHLSWQNRFKKIEKESSGPALCAAMRETRRFRVSNIAEKHTYANGLRSLKVHLKSQRQPLGQAAQLNSDAAGSVQRPQVRDFVKYNLSVYVSKGDLFECGLIWTLSLSLSRVFKRTRASRFKGFSREDSLFEKSRDSWRSLYQVFQTFFSPGNYSSQLVRP